MTSTGDEISNTLRDCMIFQKTHTQNLRDVRTLNMWGFELANIDIISQLNNAETISLSLNKISSLAPFSYCKNLQNLYLRQNCISDLREVDYLSSLPKLTSLMLRDNPISSLPNYRSYIINKIPSLKKLDDTDVTMDERFSSSNYSQPMDQPMDQPMNQPMNQTMNQQVNKLAHKQNDRESFSRTSPSSYNSYQDNAGKSRYIDNYHNNYNDAEYYSEDDSSSSNGSSYQHQQLKTDFNDPRRRINTNTRVNNNYSASNRNNNYRSNGNVRRNTNSISNYKNKMNSNKKDDSNMLTAVLSLLPELTDESLDVVLEAIQKQRNC